MTLEFEGPGEVVRERRPEETCRYFYVSGGRSADPCGLLILFSFLSLDIRTSEHLSRQCPPESVKTGLGHV